jgi:putative ABC transport system ATP-binding protein
VNDLTPPLISIDRLARHYVVGGETVRALDGVSFDIRAGEWVAIVGQSGSGKSTLMNLLGCLDTATSGTYRLNGADVETLSDDQLADLRNKEIGFVFQTFQLLPRASALANVELPLVYRGVSRKERRATAEQALRSVGLANRMHHRPNELSGGQRQRVAIARALVGEPSLLLADEPTGNLDSQTGEEIIRLFGELNSRGHTIILVTHEPRLAARCPRAIKLMDGRVLGDGPGAEVAALQGPRAVGT